MKSATSESVTYIKDGNLKTVMLNNRNKRKVLAEIFETSYYGSYNQLTASIKENIDFVRFKNVRFVDYRKFKCCRPSIKNNDTICIFDNCILELNNMSSIYFKYGTFRMLNTKLENVDGIVTIQGREFYLLENSNLNRLYGLVLNSDIVSLNGNLKISRFSIYSKSVIIGNGKNESRIDISNQKDYCSEINVITDKLILNNSTLNIDFKVDKNQIIHADKMFIDDRSKIVTNQLLCINGNEFEIKTSDFPIIINKDKLKQVEVISILKIYNNLINRKIDIQSSNLLRGKTNILEQKIKENEDIRLELEQKIKEQEIILLKLREELVEQNKEMAVKISKSLKKKSIKYFDL